MGKSRDTIAKATFEIVATKLVDALEEGTKVWPLPEPPMTDPDFPPRNPERDQDLNHCELPAWKNLNRRAAVCPI